MSAQPQAPAATAPAPQLAPMSAADLDAVVAIEQALYDFPWTRGNFVDSLHAGHLACVLRETAGLAGYFIAMSGLEEMHLLNLSVAADRQGRGHARAMLDALVHEARRRAAKELWLEVRPSNLRALALYQRYGFVRTGLRRAYYPNHGRRREDAVVMSLDLQERADGLG
ncbi:MAG TPA: ribosomal protein S18-alanine N-acetyltransferase [Methylibium sp.]|uniref:ribosomal protein S18-alanine N-acetyltransferase n=1 Tax=Methylibium sp. TaxID=2067992 RepID=UPI002DBB7866|nr:ribosomal protein S18-alanine N-acetyltransferase [Methylibium sp.]HEU4458740.1 ribosomal protein S18-alanine N-acetyltransferase [Methylibium sp.]